MKKILFYSCDIETLGVELHSPIIEIGVCAVYYDAAQSKFTYRTHSRVCAPSGNGQIELHGLSAMGFHAKTKSGRELLEASLACCHEKESLDNMFAELTHKEARANPDAIWFFRGPQFDEAMLRKQLNQSVPWKYWNVRCQRTVSKLLPYTTLENTAAEHRAGPDAKAQARDLVNRLLHLNPDVPPDEWEL